MPFDAQFVAFAGTETGCGLALAGNLKVFTGDEVVLDADRFDQYDRLNADLKPDTTYTVELWGRAWDDDYLRHTWKLTTTDEPAPTPGSVQLRTPAADYTRSVSTFQLRANATFVPDEPTHSLDTFELLDETGAVLWAELAQPHEVTDERSWLQNVQPYVRRQDRPVDLCVTARIVNAAGVAGPSSEESCIKTRFYPNSLCATTPGRGGWLALGLLPILLRRRRS